MRSELPDKKMELVKQANQVAQAVYIMPATCRKLIFFAMAKSAYHEDGFETIEATEADVCEALGMTRGGATYDLLRSITKQTKEQVFTIEEDGYRHISWMAECQYVASRGVFRFRLDPTLHQYTVAVKKQFQLVPLDAVGKLQGKYALRIFELVMTQAGQEGKNGNPPGEWWYEDTIEMLRHRFSVSPKQYTVTNAFRRKVIDGPIQEINEAGIGIQIEPVYLRHRRKLQGIRFNVRRVSPDSPAKVSPMTEMEKEDAALVAKYPDEYARLLEEERKQKPLEFVSPDMAEMAAVARAICRLRESKPKRRGKNGQA